MKSEKENFDRDFRHLIFAKHQQEAPYRKGQSVLFLTVVVSYRFDQWRARAPLQGKEPSSTCQLADDRTFSTKMEASDNLSASAQSTAFDCANSALKKDPACVEGKFFLL